MTRLRRYLATRREVFRARLLVLQEAAQDGATFRQAHRTASAEGATARRYARMRGRYDARP